MNELRNFWSWFITSSADPEKTSLAVKGILTVGGGYLLTAINVACRLGYACLPINNDTVSTGITIAVTVVTAILMLGGAVTAAIGLVRKIQNGQWSAAQ